VKDSGEANEIASFSLPDMLCRSVYLYDDTVYQTDTLCSLDFVQYFEKPVWCSQNYLFTQAKCMFL